MAGAGPRRRDAANIADAASCDDDCGIRTSYDTEFRTRGWRALTTAGFGVPFALKAARALAGFNDCGVRNAPTMARLRPWNGPGNTTPPIASPGRQRLPPSKASPGRPRISAAHGIARTTTTTTALCVHGVRPNHDARPALTGLGDAIGQASAADEMTDTAMASPRQRRHITRYVARSLGSRVRSVTRSRRVASER
jgi:hypothetical protein